MKDFLSRKLKTITAIVTLNKRSKHLSKVIIFGALIPVLLLSSLLFNLGRVRSATYTWSQTDWSGGADTVSTANHTNQIDNGSEWNKYYSSENLEMTVPGEVTVSPTSILRIDEQQEFERPGHTYSDTVWNETNDFMEMTQSGRIQSNGYYESPIIQGATDVDWSEVRWGEIINKRASFRGFVDGDFNDAVVSKTTDLDNDGDIDVVSISSMFFPGSDSQSALMWYENDGEETFDVHQISDESTAGRDPDEIIGAYMIEILDFDNDGDNDIAISVKTSDKISWYENDGDENFTMNDIICRSCSPNFTDIDGVSGMEVLDFDSDGDYDIIAAWEGGDSIAYWPNNGDMTFGNPHYAIRNALDGAIDVSSGDFDNDGDIDLVGIGYYSDKLEYYENDGNDYFKPPVVIDDIISSPTFDGPLDVLAIDLDKDTNVDILTASENGDELVWYESLGTTPPTFTRQSLDATADAVQSFYVDDINLDGYLDVIYVSNNIDQIAWLENDGASNFTKNVISNKFYNPKYPYSEDIDGDGDIDILATSMNGEVTWWENDFGTFKNVFNDVNDPSVPFLGAVDSFPIDLDNDNDMDIVGVAQGTTGADGAVAWWENDSNENFTKHTIEDPYFNPSAVFVGDIDGDTDFDIIASIFDSDIVWWENDGSQNFTIRHKINSSSYLGASDVFLADIDGDTDLDIASTAKNGALVSWWENDGTGTFPSSPTNLTTSYWGASSIYAIDIDNDTDVDFLTTAYFDDKVSVWKNNGSQVFTETVIESSFDGANKVDIVDIEGDGDMDVLASASNAGLIALWKNDGGGNFGTKIDIDTTYTNAHSVIGKDVDEDGDGDIVATSTSPGLVTWWTNNGDDTFTKKIIARDTTGAAGVMVEDIDGDENFDILVSISDTNDIKWYKNKQTYSDIKVQVRAGADPQNLGDFLGPSGLTGDCSVTSTGLPYCFSNPTGGDVSFLPDSEYFQYRIYFTTTGSSISAYINSFEIEANGILGYELTGEFQTSMYNGEDESNIMADIFWSEENPPGTEIKAQLRTSPDDGNGHPTTWSDWMGPTSTSDYYTNPSGNLILDEYSDATDDQWFQVKFTFESNVVTTPKLNDTSIKYVINDPPQITINNSVAESSVGEIYINYNIYDPDIVEDPDEDESEVYLFVDTGLTLDEELEKTDTTDISIAGDNFSFLPSSGMLMIDREIIEYSSKGSMVVTGLSRGAPTSGYHTRVSAHTTGDKVWMGAVVGIQSGSDVGHMINGNGKEITWKVEDDLPSFYKGDSYIRVVGIDSNAAKQTGYTEIGPLPLDTKIPEYDLVTLNSREDKVYISALDDSAMQLVVSNSSDLSADGVNADSGNWITYTAEKNWIPEDFDSDGIEDIYIRFRDIYGNTGVKYTVSTPKTPNDLLIQDISNIDTSDWRLFVSWAIVPEPFPGFGSYNVYRSETNTDFYDNAVLIAQVSDREVNYYVDEDLDDTKTYYYRVTVTDAVSETYLNESNFNPKGSGEQEKEYNSDLGLQPDGSGGGLFEAPVISNIAVTSITEDSAEITWETDILSDSFVKYSEDESYDSFIGTPTMVTNHSVTIENLDQDTEYFFTVSSTSVDLEKDESIDAVTQNFTTLADTTPPVISNIFSVTSLDSAGITWSTDEAATSMVEYGLTDSYGENTPFESSLVYGHAVQINNLLENTTYHYKVISQDQFGNSSESGDMTFETQEIERDLEPPEISDIVVSDITINSATISFTTDEDALAWIEYGYTTEYNRGEITSTETFKTDHEIELQGLTSDTAHNFAVFAIDTSGNKSQSANGEFDTLLDDTQEGEIGEGGEEGDNAPEITGGTRVTEIGSTSAKISWETSINSTSIVLYKEKGNENETKLISNGDVYVTEHEIVIAGLKPDTVYEYQAKSVAEDDSSITTELAEFRTTIIAKISDVAITDISFNETIISWATNIATTSQIDYGLSSSNYTSSKGITDVSTTLHSITLDNLSSGSKYYFQLKGTDINSNLIVSDEYSFTTLIPPSVTDVVVTEVTDNKVSITYKTSTPTKSKIEYTNIKTNEISIVEKSELESEHSVDISELAPGVKYEFVIIIEDEFGNTAKSDVYSFTTSIDLSGPIISSVQTSATLLDGKNLNVQAIFSWKTDEQATSEIKFLNEDVDVKTGNEEDSDGEKDMVTTHTIVLSNLKSSTVYKYTLISTDKFGNTTESDTYVLLTPAQRVSIIDLIIKNLEDIFGWTNNLKI